MIAVLLFGLMVAVSAAPRFPHGPPFAPAPYRPAFRHDHFSGEFFDTSAFWADMAKEMQEIDDMLASLSQHFPSYASTYIIQGNEYKITIPLNGFEEKDIAVKAKDGFLMVQAVHKRPQGGEQIYIDAKTLPANVNVTGTWSFDQGVLKIAFPLKSDVSEATTETVLTTKQPFKEREEIDDDSTEEKDADVGLRGDNDKLDQLFTNEIPGSRVDSTTYAVDLKDEVEFVPVRNNYQL